jgi:hypothetical protein
VALVSSGCAPTTLHRGKSRGGRRRARWPVFPQGGGALARRWPRAHVRARPRPFMGVRGGAPAGAAAPWPAWPMGLAGLAAGPKRVRGLGRRGWTGPELAEN